MWKQATLSARDGQHARKRILKNFIERCGSLENKGYREVSFVGAHTKYSIKFRIFGLFGFGLCGRTDDLGVKGKAGI